VTGPTFFGLTEAIHATISLLVACRRPSKIVVNNCIEVGLQVDAFREAVRGDEDDLRACGLLLAQIHDSLLAFFGREQAGDPFDFDFS
jgi:hypothetical protein